MKIISVIVPAYNVEGYLARCLDGLCAQTHKQLEIIVVNDGSVDGTVNVAEDYARKDARIRVISQQNSGVTAARLRGVAEAKGEWIGFVDSDDYCEPEMYARLLENAESYQADISHCGHIMVHHNKVEYYYNTGRLIKQDRIKGTADLLSGEMIEPGLCNKLYHRALFECLLREKLMPEEIKINEDLLMNFYLFRQAESAVYEDVCPYHYILRNKIKINEHQLKDPIFVSRLLLRETEDQPEWNQIVEKRLIYQMINIASMEAREQRALVLPFRASIRKELRERIPHFLMNRSSGVKLKLMALWAAIWPWSYGFVHRIYAKLTGLDKKYCVE